MRILISASLASLLALVTPHGVANTAIDNGGREFIKRNNEGWFFYNEQIEEEIEEPKRETPPPPPPVAEPEPIEPPQAQTPKGPEPLSAAWFRENLQKYEDRAIDNPTPENVAAYYYLQRIAMDKAERFSDVAQQVVMTDPNLDESARRPLSQFGTQAMDKRARKALEKQIKNIAQEAGVFFYDKNCDLCPKTAEVMNRFSINHGFVVNAVSMDGEPLPNGLFPDFKTDSGQAKQLGITGYPALFLAVPPDRLVSLGQSALSIRDLEQRVMTAALIEGVIDQEQFNSVRPINQMLVDSNELNVTEEILEDPKAFIRHLRRKMRN